MIALDPNDPETYYSIAVIDWTQSYQPRMEERAKLGLKPTEDAKKEGLRRPAEGHYPNEPIVQDGIQKLNKALELRPDYDDAMAYLNLLYREQADMDCANPDQRKTDLKTADDWVDKTMATKKQKLEKAGPTGIVTTEETK